MKFPWIVSKIYNGLYFVIVHLRKWVENNMNSLILIIKKVIMILEILVNINKFNRLIKNK